MNSFDPVAVRMAVAALTPRRPQNFQELAAAKDVIVGSRQKRGLYRAIAELFAQHSLPTSKATVLA